MNRKLVLFDIDGTILLSAGAGRRAIVAAIAEEVPRPEELTKVRFDGKTDPQIVHELLAVGGDLRPVTPDRMTRLLTRYVNHLQRELARPDHQTTVMPGILALFDALEREAGVVLGLLTGNVVPGATLKLRSASIDPARFRVGAFGSDHADRSALPPIASERAEPLFGRRPRGHEVVIIGDTPSDVTCGLGIEARAVGVATGSYPMAELAAAGAYRVFGDCSDVAMVLEAILS